MQPLLVQVVQTPQTRYNMITIGKIADRIGFDNGDLVYLGNKSGITQTELDEQKGVFFDTNNVNRFVTTNEFTNMKETDESFINNAKFYTCDHNVDDGLCFRCYKHCQDCVDCQKCDGCHLCNTCNSCVDCQTCNKCDSCVDCNKCINKYSYCKFCNDTCTSCYDRCYDCQGDCLACQGTGCGMATSAPV